MSTSPTDQANPSGSAIPPQSQSDDVDLDSAYEGSIQSETASLSSSITKYRFENGRRYHAYQDGQYWAPNDETQNDQLDIAHHIWLLLLEGKLYRAPIGDSPRQVLDIGTGTGIWAIDFADQFPSAAVTGTDLSPIQPTWAPPNCSFEISDCTQEWTFPNNHFDFIHVRSLYGSIADWPAFYKQLLAHLKPGGWYEQVEYSVDWVVDDDSLPPGHIYYDAAKYFVESGEKMGRTFRILDLQKDFVEQAGFSNVVEERYKMPVGTWPADKHLKEIGRWHHLEAVQGIEGWCMAALTRILGWSFEEVQVFLAKLREGLNDRSIHAYTRASVVYAQKPLE